MNFSTTLNPHQANKSRQIRDLLFITFGISLYAVGFTAFVLPEHVVMGGV